MHTLLGVFRSVSLLSARLLSLLNLNFRAEYTFKSRMCRGIVGDEITYFLDLCGIHEEVQVEEEEVFYSSFSPFPKNLSSL